jgi:putative FmdB family regulatory protein
MPIYEYECAHCGVIEVIQKIKDDPLSCCPKCFGVRIKRLISLSSFRLNGTGWYKTDYVKKNEKSNKS